MAVGIGVGEAFRAAVIPLALLGWYAAGFPGQTTAWHRISSERFQIRRLQAGSLSCLDCLLSGGLGLGGCCLG